MVVTYGGGCRSSITWKEKKAFHHALKVTVCTAKKKKKLPGTVTPLE